MKVNLEILKLAQRPEDIIDYNTIVFKIPLTKRINLDSSKYWWIFLKTIVDGGAIKILLDLQNLEYIDSSGLGMLINVAKMLRKIEGDLVMFNVSADIRNVFKVIKLQEFIKIFNSEGEAVNFFSYVE